MQDLDVRDQLRERILKVEERLRTSDAVVEIPVKHYFAHGVYAREIFIPKGTIVVGKIHRTEHINIVSKGDISVVTPIGITRIVAPLTMIAPAGAKECAYAHEDTVWITLHATTETDLAKIEAEFIAPTFESLRVDDVDVKEIPECLG